MADIINDEIQNINEDLGETISQIERISLGFGTLTAKNVGMIKKTMSAVEKVVESFGNSIDSTSISSKALANNISKLSTLTESLSDDLGKFEEANKAIQKSTTKSLMGITKLNKAQTKQINELNKTLATSFEEINKLALEQSVTNTSTLETQNEKFTEVFKTLKDKMVDYEFALQKGKISLGEFNTLQAHWSSQYEKMGNTFVKLINENLSDPLMKDNADIEKSIEKLSQLQGMISGELQKGMLPDNVAKAYKSSEKLIEEHKSKLMQAQNEIGYKQEEIMNLTYESMETLASGIERKFGGKLGKILFGFDPITKTLKQRNEQIMERIRKNGKRTARDVQDQMKATAKAGAQMMGKVAANAPLIIGVAVGAGIMMIASKMKGFFDDALSQAESSWETLTSRMREGIDALRMSVSQGSAMAAALNMRFVDGLEVAWGDVAKSMAGIKDIQGDMVGLGVQQAKLVTKLSIGLGASAEAAANFYFMMKNSMGGSDKIAANAGMIVSQFSKVLGMSPEDIFKDMEESSEFLMKHTKNTGKDMVKTVMEAKKLGMKLSDVAKITESMFDYESSIQNELEASLLLGRSIDFNRARQLMFNKQTDEGMKELASMMGTYEEFQDMNFIQQQGIAKAFGMSVKEYEKVLTDQQRMNSLTNEQKKQLEAINKQREKMNDLTGEAYLNSEKAKLAQESMKQSWDDLTTDLGSQFIPIMVQYKGIMMNLMKTLLPALINGFTFLVDKIITPISDFFNSKDGQNMMSAINKEVGLIFKSLGELFDEVKGVLGELFGTSKQSIGGQASGVIETIGAGIRTVIDVMKWVVGHWKELLIAFIAMKAAPVAYNMFKGGKTMLGLEPGMTPAKPLYVSVTNASSIGQAAKQITSAPTGDTTMQLKEGYKQGVDKNGKSFYYKEGQKGRVSAKNAYATVTQGPDINNPRKGMGPGGKMAAAGTLMALSAGLEFFGPEDSKAIDAIQASLMGISTALVLIEAGQLAATAATWLWNAAMAANPITWIIVGVVALGAAIVALVVYWDEVAAAMEWVWKNFVGGLKIIWGWIEGLGNWIWDKIVGTWEGISNFLKGAWDSIVNFFIGSWDKITQMWTDFWSWTKKAATSVWNNVLVPFVNFLWKGLGYIASLNPWDMFISGVQTAIKGVAWLMNLIGKIPGLGFLQDAASSMSKFATALGVAKASTYIGAGDIVSPIPMAAEGGLFKSPTAAIIGERGPELVIPAKPASELLSGKDYTPYNKLGNNSGNNELRDEINRLSNTVNSLAAAIQNMGIYMNGQKVGGVIARNALNPKLG